MSTPVPSRRRFMQTAGAAVSGPIAAAAVALPASAAPPVDPLQARLARLEDIEAIRALNHAYAGCVNAGACEELASLFADPSDARLDPEIRGLSSEPAGEPDTIDVAPDRQIATARLHRTVHAEREIGPSSPLVEMARAQGGGVVRRTERGVFELVYVKRDGAWRIQRSAYRAQITDS